MKNIQKTLNFIMISGMMLASMKGMETYNSLPPTPENTLPPVPEKGLIVKYMMNQKNCHIYE